jgi:ribosome maturation factor RimP
MPSKENIIRVLEADLEGTGLFVLTLDVKPGNDIRITLDGEAGVKVADCVKVNRIIEAHFDRDVEDYQLQVTSPGADQPLTDRRQFKRHIGRTLAIVTAEEEKEEGEMIEADDEGIVLHIKKKVKLEGRKSPLKTEEDIRFPYSDIKEARVKISFK